MKQKRTWSSLNIFALGITRVHSALNLYITFDVENMIEHLAQHFHSHNFIRLSVTKKVSFCSRKTGSRMYINNVWMHLQWWDLNQSALCVHELYNLCYKACKSLGRKHRYLVVHRQRLRSKENRVVEIALECFSRTTVRLLLYLLRQTGMSVRAKNLELSLCGFFSCM